VTADYASFGCSDRTGIETAAALRAPVFMTHARARALWDIPRSRATTRYVDGLENPSEAFHNTATWQVRDGLTDEEITKVLGGNALRALAEIWPA
jgi:microsomal dipeptidase-like Zn-dependent dipeptidase